MVATAPFCNVTISTPAPNPVAPIGFRLIPAGTPLDQAIRIINDNFSPRTQQREFERMLRDDINRPAGAKTTGFKTNPSQVRRAAQDEISKLRFAETAIVRKKMKVSNPKDKDQWIIDDRVVNLVMTDRRTKATWIFTDKSAAKGVAAGNEEATQSA